MKKVHWLVTAAKRFWLWILMILGELIAGYHAEPRQSPPPTHNIPNTPNSPFNMLEWIGIAVVGIVGIVVYFALCSLAMTILPPILVIWFLLFVVGMGCGRRVPSSDG